MNTNGRQYETCRFEIQNFKLKNKLDMKNKLSIKQRIKACFILIVSCFSVAYPPMDISFFSENGAVFIVIFLAANSLVITSITPASFENPT